MPAEIIAFPARRARLPMVGTTPGPIDLATDITVPADTQATQASRDRLRHALERLNAASTHQRQTVTGWRQALSDLQASMRALDQRLTRYRDQLDRLQTDVTGLHSQAQRLERWACNAARQERSTPKQRG